VKLAELARVSSEVAAARGRTRKTELLAALLAALAPDEVAIAIAYLTGELPQGRIGIGWAMLRDLDPGAPAAHATLELREVDARFASIAAGAGAGSGARRRDALGALYARATEGERDFLGRLLSGGLRQGALEGVMLDAIARASSLPARDVRRAAMLAGSLRAVGVAAIVERDLSRFAITLFRPISPMLASPADDVGSVLERLGRASFELKLDGARVQVHKAEDEIRVYSRSLHDVTERVPELVERARALPARSLILDGEAIALRQDGAPEPFQVTMRRFGRRLDVERMRQELPLSALYFDCILHDDRSLLDEPAHARAASLAEIVPEISRVPSLVTADPEEAERFFADALSRGHEGVMAKSLDAGYEAGSRGASWLKLKPAHTLDLVVLAVERGSGRRSGWLSNLHLGARDAATGGHVMLGKTFKGMTDAMLAWQTEHLRALAIDDDGYVVRVRPELVVEIAFADVQTSPRYPAGLALRFARVARYRTDKRASDADTIDTVRAIHARGRRDA
jgi:DNA ligase-1